MILLMVTCLLGATIKQWSWLISLLATLTADSVSATLLNYHNGASSLSSSSSEYYQFHNNTSLTNLSTSHLTMFEDSLRHQFVARITTFCIFPSSKFLNFINLQLNRYVCFVCKVEKLRMSLNLWRCETIFFSI